MKLMSTGSQLPAVRRSAAILRILATRPGGCSFSELLTCGGRLSPASLSRLLKVLADEGLVAKDSMSGAYVVGAELLRLACGVRDAVSPRDVVQPVLDALAADTRQSAAFYEPETTGAVLTAKAEIEEGFHYIRVFQRMPELPRHGFGQVLLAFTPAAVRRRWAGARWPTAAAAYARRLTAVRRGLVVLPDWAPSGGRGLIRLAAPVFRGGGGALCGVLGVTFWGGSVAAGRVAAMADRVVAAARRATDMLPARRAGVRDRAE
jgi:DNA-binding IclR family transcriptional regulator